MQERERKKNIYRKEKGKKYEGKRKEKNKYRKDKGKK